MHATSVDENGVEVLGREGELVCLSSFPSRPIYFLNDPKNERINDAYFIGFGIINRTYKDVAKTNLNINNEIVYDGLEQYSENLLSLSVAMKSEELILGTAGKFNFTNNKKKSKEIEKEEEEPVFGGGGKKLGSK